MGVEAIPSSGGVSRCRAGGRLWAAAVLLAVILAGCGPGSSSTPPVPTVPGGLAATPGPSQVVPSQAAPGSPEGDVVVTAITYSEDPASSFFAVVELGPNDAGISRLDVYRGADGRLSTIVAYGPEDLPAMITFDPEGRPLRMDASGYVVEFTYPASDVEAVITAPDGSVVRQRAPLDLGAAVPAPDPPNARLASYMGEPPPPGMVQWPITFSSHSILRIEVVHTGTNQGSPAEHVRFHDVGCTPVAGTDCALEFGSYFSPPLDPLTEPSFPLPSVLDRVHFKFDVANSVATGMTSDTDQMIWRTRADCDTYAAGARKMWSNWGWAPLGVSGIWQATAVLLAIKAPVVAGVILAAAVAIKVLGTIDEGASLDCGTVPNLALIQDEWFDGLSAELATITVTASGDCDPKSPETGWRITQPTTQTVTFQPFNPVNRSAFGASAETFAGIDHLPVIGTITFQAADCAVDMEGAFDLAATAAAVGMPASEAGKWAKLFTRNQIALDVKTTDGEPTSPTIVAGTFALTYRVPARGYVTGYDDCVMTSTVTGTLEGTLTQAGAYRATGLATIKMVPSLQDCPASFFVTKTRILRNVKWTASGKDETALKGEIVFSANPTAVDGPPVSWIFEVSAKP